MAILEELKAKANGKADTANNIQEAVSMMEFGGGGGSETGTFIIHFNGTNTSETAKEVFDAVAAGKYVLMMQEDTSYGSDISYSALKYLSRTEYASTGTILYSLEIGTTSLTAHADDEYFGWG